MPSPKDDAEAFDEYAREMVADWMEKRGTVKALALKMGVSPGFISQFRGKRTGLGLVPLLGLCDAYGLSLADFVERARAFRRTGKAVFGARVEYDDRYPARGLAAKAAALLGIRPDAIGNVLGFQYKEAEARDAAWWFNEMRFEADRLTRLDENPGLRAAEDAQAERDTAQLLERERVHLAGREELLKKGRGKGKGTP